MMQPGEGEHLREELKKLERSLLSRITRRVAWTFLGLLLLLILLVAGLAWYTTTASFQQRVRKEVVHVLEDATGGRVELKAIQFNLWHLAVEADGLVIHGLEGPGEAPYLSIDKTLVRVRILNFLSHTTGSGPASYVNLSLLHVEHPQIHLIIDKDGKTNQPVPKHPTKSSKPLIDTLLDLKAREADVVQGIALINDRAIPFDLAARDLEAQVQYLAATDRYGAVIDLNDLRTRMKKEPEAQSKLHVEAELGRDIVELKQLDLHTGDTSTLTATGSLQHFAKPEWQAKLKGSLALTQISVLTGFDGLSAGSVDLDLNGHSCAVTPVEAQRHPHFWELRHRRQEVPSTKSLPPDPDCQAGYLIAGSAKIHKAAYADEYVRLHDIDGGAQLHVTPSELLLKTLTGYLPGGGSATGDLRISNWLGEVPATAPASSPTTVGALTTANKTATALKATPPATRTTLPPVQPAHAYLTATVNRIPLRTIMAIVAPKNYGDLGFDTSITGPVKAEWGGPATDIADTVQVDADLNLSPTGVRLRNALSNIPVNGHILGHYAGKSEVVQIQQLNLQTPESNVDVTGVLGVNKGDPLTNLRADLKVHDLGEYDQLLQTLGFSANGKKGVAAIPVALHGSMEFNGTASGALAKLDLKGHLTASQVEVKLDSRADVQVDSVIADAEYSPQAGLAVATSTIKRGTAVLNVSGTARPQAMTSRRGVVLYEWNDHVSVDAKVKLADAQLTDVLQIAGQQQNIPVTGTLSLDAHVTGTMQNLDGSGNISLLKGTAYGQPYDSLISQIAVRGQAIAANNLVLKLNGMQVVGNGGYDLTSEQLHGHLEARDLHLAKFQAVQKSGVQADGVLNFVADANGTLKVPNLKANLQLAQVTFNHQPFGDLTADLHSSGSTLYLTSDSTLLGAKFNLAGQAQLAGDYQAQAKLTLTSLDVGKALAIFAPDSIKASSSISGVVNVSGPLKNPKALSGNAELQDVRVNLQGIDLKAAEPMRVSLSEGTARLDQIHITGQDTDLRLGGTAQVFGSTDPRGGPMHITADGSVSAALAHTFDPDLISSGKATFTVVAGGRLKKPALSGKVQFEKVNIAMEGIPNGLSNMNGTLVFSQDRLLVQDLTATTGGGQLKIGGFLTYRNGLYADLTATGDTVRVRLYGLSATANANLRLQGGPQNLLLSGSILLTRFNIGPDVDFAAFSSAGGVSAPPDPNAPTNKIHLDVRVTSSPQLDFQNSYAKLAGTVDLTIRGTVAEPTILGHIQINDGSATFAGTNYQLQRGDIYFNNPIRIDPTIDIDATARVENYDVTVGLHGTMENLKPTYRSEPPLSEADIFALLALGRTQEEAQLYQEQQVQQGVDPTTSSLLGGALNATVSNRVQKLFGVGSVKIDPAFVGTLGNSSARITVQQQISRQITATFATNVNYSAQQLIQVQYNFSDNKSIVITRDETGVFSIVYKLRERYR